MELEILVQTHIANEYNNEFNAAKILLNDDLIKLIFRLSKRAGKDRTIKEWECSPEVGNSEIDLDIDHYRNTEDLSSMMGDTEVFKPSDSRIDTVELNVTKTHFWWTGYFKFSGETWETREIPLDILPQELRQVPRPKKTPELNPQLLEEILELARSGDTLKPIDGIEIPKKITKVHLLLVIQKLMTLHEGV